MITADIIIESRIIRYREEADKMFRDFIGEIAEFGAVDIKENFTLDHVPSYPGEPPAVRTGFLRDSVSGTQASAQLEAEIEVEAYYGILLEFGTEKIAPRPFVRPAVHRLVLEIPRLGEAKFNND